MNKPARERTILEIVSGHPVGTQEELAQELRRRGTAVTQATVSRDVKRLGLVKVADATGAYRYAIPNGAAVPTTSSEENLRNAFREFVTGLASGEAFFVVQTLPGVIGMDLGMHKLRWLRAPGRHLPDAREPRG